MAWKGWEDYVPAEGAPAPLEQLRKETEPAVPKLDRGRGRMKAVPAYVTADLRILRPGTEGLPLKGQALLSTVRRLGLKRFKSTKEATHYVTLALLQRAGSIAELQSPHPIGLHATAPSGQKVQIGMLNLDFSFYDHRLKKTVWQDVKGNPRYEDLYRWKKRHAEIQYSITIEEV